MRRPRRAGRACSAAAAPGGSPILTAPGQYQLRPADAGSLDLLVELSCHTFEQAYAGVHSAADIRAYCASHYSPASVAALLEDPLVACMVAMRGLAPLGYYLLQRRDCPLGLGPGAWELKRLYVLASQYGSGLGRALFADALARVAAGAGPWLWLCVADSNRRARRFYRKLNCRALGAGPILVVGEDRLSSTIMARRAPGLATQRHST